MEFFPSSFSSPSSPSFFLYLSGMPPSLLGETQPLLAFEVKVVHKRLIVQWAWLNYGLQMGLSHWSVNGHHISCGWWAGVLAGHWWQTCWSLTSVKYSQLGAICGPGCGSYEALWCWEEMRSQVEAGWGLEANLICLSCFWDPWTSFPCDLLPVSLLQAGGLRMANLLDSCGRQNIDAPLLQNVHIFTARTCGYDILQGQKGLWASLVAQW